jgi:hypothetical protein
MARKLNLDVAERLDIICKKGDSFNMSITVTDESGAGLDLRGYSISIQVRSNAGSTINGVYTPGAYILGVTQDKNRRQTPCYRSVFCIRNGVITITSSATEMSKIDAGVYVYEIQQVAMWVVTPKQYLRGRLLSTMI